MTENEIITSAKRAVRVAYFTLTTAYASLGVLTSLLYLNAQRIAEKHVAGGIWNPEAWNGNDWGADGNAAFMSLIGAGISGVFTAIAFPALLKSSYDSSNTQTRIDKERKIITQTKPTYFDKNGVYFERSEDCFEYDAILSVSVTQTPFQRKSNVGNLEITAIRLVEEEKKRGHEGNSKLEEETITIPLQEDPFAVRDRIFQGSSHYKALKDLLRTVA